MHGLEEEYRGALKAEIRDATTPKHKAEIREHGFETHGMVIYDAEGQLKKKLDGHLMQEPEIRRAVRDVVGDETPTEE